MAWEGGVYQGAYKEKGLLEDGSTCMPCSSLFDHFCIELKLRITFLSTHIQMDLYFWM